jgi:Ca2+-binding EF-hand superfamily protein
MQSNNPLKRLSTREQVLMITMMAVGAALPGFLQEVKEEEMLSDSQILELQELFNKFDDLAGEITEEDLKDMVLELLHEYV